MLQVSHYSNFKGFRDAVLLSGDQEGIYQLRLVFSEWKHQNVELLEILASRGKINIQEVKSICIKKSYNNDRFVWTINSGIWHISMIESIRIIGLLDGLLNDCENGHQYLYREIGSVGVIASKNEYL